MKFSDASDRASHLEELERQHLTAKARQNINKMPFTGYCYFCAEETQSPRIFCDVECRDMYEHEQAAHRRNGTA